MEFTPYDTDSLENVLAFLAGGGDVNVTWDEQLGAVWNNYGQDATALHWACYWSGDKQATIVEAILNARADITLTTSTGKLALDIACEQNSSFAPSLLARLDPNDGGPPVIVAVDALERQRAEADKARLKALWEADKSASSAKPPRTVEEAVAALVAATPTALPAAATALLDVLPEDALAADAIQALAPLLPVLCAWLSRPRPTAALAFALELTERADLASALLASSVPAVLALALAEDSGLERRALRCLVNLARAPVLPQAFALHALDACSAARLAMLKSNNGEEARTGVLAAVLLALVAGKNEVGPGAELIRASPLIMSKLAACVDCGTGERDETDDDVVLCALRLAQSDQNKPRMACFVEAVVKSMERGSALASGPSALAHLAFDKSCRAEMDARRDRVIAVLDKADRGADVRAACAMLYADLKPVKGASAARRVTRALGLSPKASSRKKGQHVLIVGAAQHVITKAWKSALEAQGLSVLAVADMIDGAFAETLADAVDGATALLLLASSSCKASAFCRRAVELANDKPHVAAHVEAAYVADGWLAQALNRGTGVVECVSAEAVAPSAAPMVLRLLSESGVRLPSPSLPPPPSTSPQPLSSSPPKSGAHQPAASASASSTNNNNNSEVLGLLRALAADMAALKADLTAVKDDVAALKTQHSTALVDRAKADIELREIKQAVLDMKKHVLFLKTELKPSEQAKR